MEALTFSQCLSKIMQKHRLSDNDLATLIGARADLKRVLADESTNSKRKHLYDKLKASHLFDEHDYEQLKHSLEISQMGIEQYRFQEAISEILTGKSRANVQEPVNDSGMLLKDRLKLLDEAEQIEILCFNCCYHSVFSLLAPLFHQEDRNISMRHYIQADSSINAAAEYVAVVMPLLFDERYTSFYRPETTELKIPSIGGNLLFIRAMVKENLQEFLFVFTNDHLAYEYPNAATSHLFSFCKQSFARRICTACCYQGNQPIPA